MNSLYREFGPGQQNTQRFMNPNDGFQTCLQNAMNQTQQVLQSLRDPRQYQPLQGMLRYLPAEMQNDPDQILMYFQQNPNMLNPLQRQALSMLYRR